MIDKDNDHFFLKLVCRYRYSKEDILNILVYYLYEKERKKELEFSTKRNFERKLLQLLDFEKN
jgi:hypothetical protein